MVLCNKRELTDSTDASNFALFSNNRYIEKNLQCEYTLSMSPHLTAKIESASSAVETLGPTTAMASDLVMVHMSAHEIKSLSQNGSYLLSNLVMAFRSN